MKFTRIHKHIVPGNHNLGENAMKLGNEAESNISSSAMADTSCDKSAILRGWVTLSLRLNFSL